MLAAFETQPSGFDADELHARILIERREEADGVASAPNTGNRVIGEAAGLLEHLCSSLGADDCLKIAHHHRVGMGADDAPNEVIARTDVGDPIPHRFVDCVFERLASGSD